jgi:hypothetical protein
MTPVLSALFVSVALAAKPPAALTTALDDFTQGAASRDTERVARALHPEARQYVAMPDGLQVMDTASYLKLLSDGVIGGTPTTRTTHDVEIKGTQALVHQTRDIGAMKLHDAATLIQADGRWQIVSVAVSVEKD